jgi:hypothetical protein
MKISFDDIFDYTGTGTYIKKKLIQEDKWFSAFEDFLDSVESF